MTCVVEVLGVSPYHDSHLSLGNRFNLNVDSLIGTGTKSRLGHLARFLCFT